MLDKRVQKGKMTEEDKQNTMQNMHLISNLEEAKDVDLAIEAVFEDLKVKQDSFKKLDEIIQPNAILASNTSALQATPMASVVTRADKFIIVFMKGWQPRKTSIRLLYLDLTGP